MQNPPLQPLHLSSVLSRAKLNHYARLTTEELIRRLSRGKSALLRRVLTELSSTDTTGSLFFANVELM
jgi:hypothetical protein